MDRSEQPETRPSAETYPLHHGERIIEADRLRTNRLEIHLAPDSPRPHTFTLLRGELIGSDAPFLLMTRTAQPDGSVRGLESVPLDPGTRVELGRDAPQTAAPLRENDYVSRYHGLIIIEADGSVRVVDDSRNGSRVDLIPTEPVV